MFLKYLVCCICQFCQYGFGIKFSGDYSLIDFYVEMILVVVESGELLVLFEFYGLVWFKGVVDLKMMVKEGVEYIELWMFDFDLIS